MTSEIHDAPQAAPKLYGVLFAAALIAAAGLYGIGRFNENDLARDMQAWREKLNLIAESRNLEVEKWVAGNFAELRALADNPSLQLYMVELQMMQAPGDKTARPAEIAAEPSQKAYLRNLLLFTAQRAGFSASAGTSSIPANVGRGGDSGLAIVDNANVMVVSTPMSPSARDVVAEHARQAAAGQEALIDIRKNREGQPYIGFVAPVFALQGDRVAAAQIGQAIGVKILDDGLFALLKHPGVTEKTLEALLVRAHDGRVEYLSPLLDGSETLGKSAAAEDARLAEAGLLQAGGFSSDLRDYRDRLVLATSRPVAGTPWTLIVKIDRAEALLAGDQRRAGMTAFFLVILAFLAVMAVALWRWMHSKQTAAMSVHFRKLAEKAQAQERLLRLVADHQPEPVYIVDTQQVVRFANDKMAADARMSAGGVLGKSLRDIRGAAGAQDVAEQCATAREAGCIRYHLRRAASKDGEKVIRSAYVPLEHIPIAGLPEPTPGVLVVEQDVSEVMHERERRLEMQSQLIETLVTLVDRRDPFAAHHSQLVSQIAYEVALEMELDDATAETTRIAGTLMNIGKIVVPAELLTKATPLTPEEKQVIQDSINAAAELLGGVRFDGPVAETLRQWQEKWDGTGPIGLKGEEILISARIIAVANAFTGMISPRSWRTAIPIEAAAKFLLDQCDTHFDRRAVIATINFIENHNGRKWLYEVLEEQRKAA